MRSLRPNPGTGIIVPTQQSIKHGGQITPYTKPTRALEKIDRLLGGDRPRICILRKQGGLGDVLMTLPTVRAISKKYGAKIDYGTDFDYLDGCLPAVLQYNPYIENIRPWRDVQVEDYDAIIDLTCPCVAHEIPLAKPINRIDLFARHVGIQLVDTSIDYFITEEERGWAKKYLYESGLDRYTRILVQPSSSTTNRDLPVAKLKDALTQILQVEKTARALIITHNSDNIKTEWKYSNVHCLNNFPARNIMAIMEQCQLVICPDSAILHMASALHKQTVALFGPTDPNARVNHHPEAVAIWPAGHLKTSPIWYAPSPTRELCWKLIEPALIRDVALSLLGQKPLPQSNDLVCYKDKPNQPQLYEVI